MTKTISPPTKPSRVSVPVSAEALEAFQRLAKAGNMSTGGAIAQWLDDTLEGVAYMAATMERARAAPKLVAQELHAYALGLADETGELIQKVRAMGLGGKGAGIARATAHLHGQPEPIPPSCNTGGKLPKNTSRPKGGNSGFPLPPAKVQAYADTNGVPPKAPK
jgi:hypothetical protein